MGLPMWQDLCHDEDLQEDERISTRPAPTGSVRPLARSTSARTALARTTSPELVAVRETLSRTMSANSGLASSRDSTSNTYGQTRFYPAPRPPPLTSLGEAGADTWPAPYSTMTVPETGIEPPNALPPSVSRHRRASHDSVNPATLSRLVSAARNSARQQNSHQLLIDLQRETARFADFMEQFLRDTQRIHPSRPVVGVMLRCSSLRSSLDISVLNVDINDEQTAPLDSTPLPTHESLVAELLTGRTHVQPR